jgi:sensor histidine kinase YesM
MSAIELEIRPKDWLSVLVIGALFSTLLAWFGGYLLGLNPWNVSLFGVCLGLLITTYSLVFISSMNRYLLPKVTKFWWDGIAALFSFLAGFLGTLTTHYLLKNTPIQTIGLFETHPYQTASLIGLLTYLIGALMYRVVKTRNQKEHSDTLFIHSRLSSLETQLNPHFLFNALNSLAELIHQDPNKAEEAVLKISTFLRNTMGEKALISVEEELRNVGDYIDLENIRFNGAITLEISPKNTALSHPIPKFSIQLLCENGIKHGMKHQTKPFIITIVIVQTHPLTITVSNNGTPITHTQFGIGLSNLQERLRHLCKGEVTLTHLNPPTYTLTLKECHEHPHC